MWTKHQLTIFQRALAASQKWEKALAKLAEIAKHSPAFADRINELLIRADNVAKLVEAAIVISAEAGD